MNKKISLNFLQKIRQGIVETKEPFFGTLLRGIPLNEEAKQKTKQYYEMKIYPENRVRFEEEGWSFKKQFRNSILMEKEKTHDELLEDSVWLLFKNMGFHELNKDRNFKINVGPIWRQIDIFAKDDNNIFIIECKSKSEKNSKSLKDEICKISDLKRNIKEAIRKVYNKSFRVSFLIVTRNILWSPKEEKLASEKGIFYWKDEDLESYKTLVEQLGQSAKYQMYSLLFPMKKASEVSEIKVPAMRGGKGSKPYYCFLIHPENLFKIAYVHRREKSNPKEIESTYQRMVNKKRIEDIGEYIDSGHSFPNNVIIAFKQNIKKPEFKVHPKVDEASGISYGTLTFPPYYGCAWIIDGQHRLYGYAKSEHASDPKHTLPVIAFESLDVKEQANLFVDINERQKAVNKNLLWELYSDIYEGSDDKKQQLLRAISMVAKKLNSDVGSKFCKHIEIPSLPAKNKKVVNLTLTTICDCIKENRLLNKDEGLLFKEDYEYTFLFATEIIKAYFEVIAKYLNEDWEQGERGLARTNVGIRIFFTILRQILTHFIQEGKRELYQKNDLNNFKNEVELFLGDSLLKRIKTMSDREKSDIREQSSKTMVLKNTQKLIWDLKQNTNFGIELWRKGGWTPDLPEEATDSKIKELLDDTEPKLMNFIVKKLKELHGEENWWGIGIPSDIKENIERIIQQDINKCPWKKGLLSAPPERRLINALTSDWKKVIIGGDNWSIFKKTFGKDKENVSVSFKWFENIRNKYKHPTRLTELSEVEKGLGYWFMGFIRECIGLDPKKV
ncbi:MAG: DGQHR domain-containing protein [Nanoarchaeota archaeon]|nr:DGQHR domain-containing protein [Nanoarchaeota archaeon]